MTQQVRDSWVSPVRADAQVSGRLAQSAARRSGKLSGGAGRVLGLAGTCASGTAEGRVVGAGRRWGRSQRAAAPPGCSEPRIPFQEYTLFSVRAYLWWSLIYKLSIKDEPPRPKRTVTTVCCGGCRADVASQSVSCSVAGDRFSASETMCRRVMRRRAAGHGDCALRMRVFFPNSPAGLNFSIKNVLRGFFWPYPSPGPAESTARAPSCSSQQGAS